MNTINNIDSNRRNSYIRICMGTFITRLIMSKTACKEAFSQIDVQLKRRTDLIPNLVETVKGYAKHERGVFDKSNRA